MLQLCQSLLGLYWSCSDHSKANAKYFQADQGKTTGAFLYGDHHPHVLEHLDGQKRLNLWILIPRWRIQEKLC
jgi:hypothetical protein